MRATKYRHCESECDSVKKTKKTNSGKKLKFVSVFCAVCLATAALILPTTTLAPNVDAYEDGKVASFSVGSIGEFSSVIEDNCVEETTLPETQPPTEPTTAKPTEPKTEPTKKVQEDTQTATETAEPADSNNSYDSYSEPQEEIVYEIQAPSADNGNALIAISNPDSSYVPARVVPDDRALLERLVMGEAGGTNNFECCALVAQCIRDSMNRSGTNSVRKIINDYQYSARTDIAPNSTVKRAVSFIFDQNGVAIQHRVICFHIGVSGWHSTQNYLLTCAGVKFYDLKY